MELPNAVLDGISITKSLSTNASLDRPPFYWQFGKGDNAQWAVRDGDWKLIANPSDTSLPQSERIHDGRLKEPWFLANLASDVGEQTNLADSRPDIRDRLICLGREIQSGF